MNSINENQPEENRADLQGQEAIAKIKELVEKAETCFFCTAATIPGSTGARPMSVQQVDDSGNLWFLSADDSHKNQELLSDQSVQLFFQGSAALGFPDSQWRSDHYARSREDKGALGTDREDLVYGRSG